MNTQYERRIRELESVLADCRVLIKEAIDQHVYTDADEVQPDCQFHATLERIEEVLA